jgi:photosystem II stability/assembly factor-like uncharacterized protein
MFRNSQPTNTRFLAVATAALFLAACGSSSESSSPNPGPIVDPGDPPGLPVNVQVVSGDGDSSDVQNTISWALDTSATEYVVYWDNAPGVDENSSVVAPTLFATRYVIHSGVDVLPGNTYYYRVEALSANGSSGLSEEVAGTPQQSVTNNQLNDVAWNGTNKLVAVGDSGVILASVDATTDAWTDVAAANVAQQLAAVTWESVNSQFLIVGAGSVVLSGDGSTWTQQDLSNLPGAVNLQDVTWLGDKYIAVGNGGAVLTSNADGSAWIAQDAGAGFDNIAFNAVAASDDVIVIVGSNGTILTSADSLAWSEQLVNTNNDLNDVTWNGSRFVAVGSHNTILTSPDGATWTSHLPGTADINFVAVTQWDAGLPQTPVVAAVGSSGTFVVDPDGDPGVIVQTGTNEQLLGLTQVDDGLNASYFVMVGHDGTVLSAQIP